MFTSITEKISGVFKNLRGLGKISDKNIADALQDIRLALISSDVNREAADSFIDSVRNVKKDSNVCDPLITKESLDMQCHEKYKHEILRNKANFF